MENCKEPIKIIDGLRKNTSGKTTKKMLLLSQNSINMQNLLL